ncbi:hypothetical protein RE428_23490 [Marinobacter nanhaiticus D15-8W]|nr:hypothetical protein RE428_23490 [Marinobacter nanhaiticus D15-8W]
MIYNISSITVRCLFLVMMTTLVAGCSHEPAPWNGRDIEGVMPDLAFDLEGTGGRRVHASDTEGQVRLLFFGFTSCPDVCPATLAYLQQVFEAMPEGRRDEVTALFVSVDPKRDNPERLEK